MLVHFIWVGKLRTIKAKIKIFYFQFPSFVITHVQRRPFIIAYFDGTLHTKWNENWWLGVGSICPSMLDCVSSKNLISVRIELYLIYEQLRSESKLFFFFFFFLTRVDSLICIRFHSTSTFSPINFDRRTLQIQNPLDSLLFCITFYSMS